LGAGAPCYYPKQELGIQVEAEANEVLPSLFYLQNFVNSKKTKSWRCLNVGALGTLKTSLMQKLQSLQNFEWILKEKWNLGERPDGGNGHTIQHCFPDKFESYFKLLHPLFEDITVINKKLTWDDSIKDYEEKNLIRLSWNKLANEYGVKIVPEISFESFRTVFSENLWPRYIIGPEEGNLETSIMTPLQKILMNHIKQDEEIYFAYFFLATDDWENPEWTLYKGSLNEIMDFENLDGFRFTPTYWWPESKSWCVCSDYDLDFTLIAGAKDLMADLSNSIQFEGLEVDVLTRIDNKADTINL
tara:strand:- start:16003 stop:16908 length:906 start_codon:yes stop_codon:yes gene_type:complete